MAGPYHPLFQRRCQVTAGDHGAGVVRGGEDVDVVLAVRRRRDLERDLCLRGTIALDLERRVAVRGAEGALVGAALALAHGPWMNAVGRRVRDRDASGGAAAVRRGHGTDPGGAVDLDGAGE